MSLDLSRIKALCFDIDGTLSDTDDLFVLRLTRLLTPLRTFFKNHDPKPFARRVVMATETPGNFLFGLPDRLGIDDELAAIADWIYSNGLGRKEHPFLLIPGVTETLVRLVGHYPMAVVSARGKRNTDRFLEQFNLTQYFNPVVTAQTRTRTKPHPEPILWAAEVMGVEPTECLMIGDTTVDIIAGRAAGAQAVGVLCGFGQEEELVKAGADLILKSTAMLPEALFIDG